MTINQIDDEYIVVAGSMGSKGFSGFIEEQERNGRKALLASVVIPTDRSHVPDSVFEALGFKFDAVLPNDPMFQGVELPPGWTREGSDHAMWSYLHDEKGRRRASIFYKAAFYDRRACLTLAPRFTIQMDYERPDHQTVRQWRVLDGGKAVFSRYGTVWTSDGAVDYGDRSRVDDACRKVCRDRLAEIVPRWADTEWQLSPECWALEIPESLWA